MFSDYHIWYSELHNLTNRSSLMRSFVKLRFGCTITFTIRKRNLKWNGNFTRRFFKTKGIGVLNCHKDNNQYKFEKHHPQAMLHSQLIKMTLSLIYFMIVINYMLYDTFYIKKRLKSNFCVILDWEMLFSTLLG